MHDTAGLLAAALVKGKKLPTARAVVAEGYLVMQRGQLVFIPSAMNWLMTNNVRRTPRSIFTGMVKTTSKPV